MDGYYAHANSAISSSGLPADSTKHTCQKCPDGCKTCDSEEWESCKTCFTGYKLVLSPNSNTHGHCTCDDDTFWAENWKMCLPLTHPGGCTRRGDVWGQEHDKLAHWVHPYYDDDCMPCFHGCTSCVGPENG